MADHTVELLRAARSAARLGLPQAVAMEQIVGAAVDATVEDLARAIAATYHLPDEDKWGAGMRRLLESAQELGLFRTQ